MNQNQQGKILHIQATEVLEKTIEASREGFKIICHQGGSRSSKTWSIFQFFILKAMAGEKFSLTIVRDKLSWIRSTVLKDFQEILELYGLNVIPDINPNRQEQVYDLRGSEFAFYGLDYPQKLHGRKQDWFWINEVMEVNRASFDQLEMRTTIGGIIDYNPIDDMHWIFSLLKREDVKLIKSTWHDNPFLEQPIVSKILSYEPTEENIANGTADAYMWEVYGLGNKARLQGTIFNNWDIVDEIPKDAKFIGYGQDFGFTNDPTTLIALYMMDNELYWDEVLYRTGMTNQDIVQTYQRMKIDGRSDIFADSAEPKSIEEIRRSGFNIRGVIKGQDSVMFGIDLLKGFKMHITRRSSNIEMELRRYKYAEDKMGKALNKPIDAYNHCIDAMRYIAMMVLRKKPELRIISGASLGL